MCLVHAQQQWPANPEGLRRACAQVGVNTQPGEEPRWRHFSFFTVGIFTSEARARACIAQREQLRGRVSVWPLTLNAPLRPCLGSDVLSAAHTRLLVRARMRYILGSFSKGNAGTGGGCAAGGLNRQPHAHRAALPISEGTIQIRLLSSRS